LSFGLECASAFALQLLGQRLEIDTRPREFSQHTFGVAAVVEEHCADFTVIRRGLQRKLQHSVDSVRSRERPHVPYIILSQRALILLKIRNPVLRRVSSRERRATRLAR